MRTIIRRTIIAALVASFAALTLGAAPVRAATPQENATQVQGKPNTFYWAVLVGINDYAGNTQDLNGAAQDARSIYNYLLSIGWRSDHIMLFTDKSATYSNIIYGLRWLARKTNNKSAAVFHFSGHEMPFSSDKDGDKEKRDIAMRTYENKFLYDGVFGKELAKIHAYRMWIDMALCRAGGFNDPGTTGKNRVVTYSSPESELSYEDPSLQHSVFSYYAIVSGMKNKAADKNKDGQVTVEEAFWYSRTPTTNHTSGKQHPQMNDQMYGDFILKPPVK